jgi:putative transposase
MRDELPVRRQPVHGVKVTADGPTIIFLTVCTKGRRPWLARPPVHELLHDIWRAADKWLVGRYIVMPDHVHLFAGLTTGDVPLDNWVRYWKSQFTKAYGQPECGWETGHWDTRMRTAAQDEEKWRCVRQNPVRHALVPVADDWPYQGEVHVLEW